MICARPLSSYCLIAWWNRRTAMNRIWSAQGAIPATVAIIRKTVGKFSPGVGERTVRLAQSGEPGAVQAAIAGMSASAAGRQRRCHTGRGSRSAALRLQRARFRSNASASQASCARPASAVETVGRGCGHIFRIMDTISLIEFTNIVTINRQCGILERVTICVCVKCGRRDLFEGLMDATRH